MTTPDIYETVGFKKGKFGSGDKELGYAIKKNRLGGLIVGSCCCFGILGTLVFVLLFEVRLERRSFHKQLRREEHTAASKLAKVEMELWAQYHEDIKESHEAHGMLQGLNASYEQFSKQIHGAIGDAAKEVDLNQDKAAHLADTVLDLIAEMRAENLKHTKHLVDHLVLAGKRGVKLEQHVSEAVAEDIGQEEKRLKDNGDESYFAHDVSEGNETLREEDALKGMLEGFWFTFNDYENEFKDKARDLMKEGHPVFEQLKDLQANMSSDMPPSEEEISDALGKMDFASAGVGLDSGRVLPAADIVEELLLIPKIPHKELSALEQAWRKGEQDSVTVFEKLTTWHQQGLVPFSWLQAGVRNEEQARVGVTDDEAIEDYKAKARWVQQEGEETAKLEAEAEVKAVS